MKLYLLTTKGLGDFYLVSESPNEAQDKLTELLVKADYGFTDRRKVTNIKWLTDEISEFPKGKPNFSNDGNLILPTS